MKTKKQMQRFLSIFLACIMILNVPMSALAFEDVMIAEEVEMYAETDGEDGDLSEEDILIEAAADTGNASEEGTDSETSSNTNKETGAGSSDDEWIVDDQLSDELEILDIEEYEADPMLTSLDAEAVVFSEEAGSDTSDLQFKVTDPAGYVTVSFVDNGVRPKDASITDEELYGEALGTIIDEVEVPFVEGDSIADVTVRLLDAMAMEYDYTGTVDNGFYLAALKKLELNGKYYATFGEFDAGKDSGWCVRLNNWHIDKSAAAVEVSDEDVVSWLYTCQLGADIGVDYSNPSADITDVKLKDTSLNLVYDENKEEYSCEVPFSQKELAFEVELKNYASVITVTVDGNEVNYRPNKAIAVTPTSKIVISTSLEYMDAANNNETTTYRDSVTIQLSEKENHAPTVKENATSELTIKERMEQTLDLSTVFEDADNDTLSYTVTVPEEIAQRIEDSNLIFTASKAGNYSLTISATDGKDSVTHTITLTVAENHAPKLKETYAESKSATYVYSSSYVYIYMKDIFEDQDGDTLTYSATLDGEAVDITYNSWLKEYYILFQKKPAVCEYKIKAFDGVDWSEEFTAKCIGTTATITAAENEPLYPNGNYYYYFMGSKENDTFKLNYTLDVEETLQTEWYSGNSTVLKSNGDGTFTLGTISSRSQVTAAVTCGKDSWGSLIYLGTKQFYIIPSMPEFNDVTVALPEHEDLIKATTVNNVISGGLYVSEFDYTVEDPTIASFTVSGSYGLSITPKSLGTTKVTAVFKYNPSITCEFNITVTGRSLQMKDRPGEDSVIYGKDKTVQMVVQGAVEGESFTWNSSDDNVAEIDENGLVTVKNLGQTYITATSSLSTEEAPLKASMYLQVKADGKVYLDDIAIKDYSYFDGFISAKSAFNSAQLEYDWKLQENRYTYSTLAFTPYFDDEALKAVLHYQISGEEPQTQELHNETLVNISKGLNPGENEITIDVYPVDDEKNVTTYTFHIYRPYNPNNTITFAGIFPNGESALTYPTYLKYKEGTLFQCDAETHEPNVNQWGNMTTSWSSTYYTYKTYIFGSRTESISVYPRFAYENQRVMIYVDGVEFEEAVTNWNSTIIPVSKDKETVITFHVNSEKYHVEQLADGVEDPFETPEKIYTIYVESVEPLGIDSKILSAELADGEFYQPGFQSSNYTISGLIPADLNTTDLKFTVPAGIDVYKTSATAANKLEPTGHDEDGNNLFSTPIVTITGSGSSASSTTNIILQVTDEEGNVGNTQYAFTVNKRGTKDIYPDSIVEYLCLGSQYTNLSSYGTMPERTLKENGSALSLGSFGGYIVYKYDTPIINDPNNPYGIDFIVYGNAFGSGAHEPGYVQVSQDGKTWYTLAGSDHYEKHNDWNYTITYTNSNGQSAWTASDGASGLNYRYPLASSYPYFNWTEALEQSITASGYRLDSGDSEDIYGSAAAVLTDFGYADVNTNGSITGISNNPYNHPGTLVAGGDQFDLDWAVDANGMPVQLDSISYIKVATASSIYAGAIGEKSTEVTAVNRVTNTAASAVGETTAPTSILINGEEISVPENGGVLTIEVPPVSQVSENTQAMLTAKVNASEDANIYINNKNGIVREYTELPDKGIIRIIVQEGEKEPYICYLKLRAVENAVTDVEALVNAIGEVTLANKNAVQEARAAYEALTADQKKLVDENVLKVLEAAEARIAELEKSQHTCSWDSGTVTKAATCKTTGIRTYTCDCGKTKTEVIPANEHTAGTWTETKAATCKETGTKVQKCSVCGEVLKTESIPVTNNHKYASWTKASDATVFAAETQKHTCIICGASETKNVGSKLKAVLEVPGKLTSISIKKGNTKSLNVTMANGDSVASVKSSAPKTLKVTLDKNGKITLKALKKGSAKLTIKLASKTQKTYTVKVVTGTVKTTKVTVTSTANNKLTLKQGKTHQLKTELKPFTSTQKVTYKTSNKKVATVTSAGKIKAVGAGKATITVTSGSKKVKVTVTVPGITGLKSSVSVKKNKTLTLKPKTYGISEKVTYTSSDPKVATVTAAGKVKGIKKGTAKITVQAGSYKKTVTVKVK